MTPYRLRILLADEPGRLGRAAMALSELGVNILDVDVQSSDGIHFADDVLVDLGAHVDPSMVDAALAGAGIELLDLRQADSHDAVDAIVRALDIAHALCAGPTPDDERVLDAVAQLVPSDRAWLTPEKLLALHGAAAEAMISGSPHQRREWAKSVRNDDGPLWTLAIPFDCGDDRRVLTVMRRGPRFTFSETARLQAVLRIAGSRMRVRRHREPRPLVPAG